MANGNLKLYFQLYLKLRDQILHGELESGSEFPTIENLQNQYAVSKETVRKSMNLLEKEGLVTRKQGNVSLVRQDVDLGLLNEPVTYEEAWTKTKSLQVEMLSNGWMTCPKRLKKFFKDPNIFNKEGHIYRYRILWQSEENSRRKSLMEAYLPQWRFDEFKNRNVADAEFFKEIFQNEAYSALMKVMVTIRPCFCDSESSKILGIPEGTPLFSKQKIHMDSKDRILMVTEGMITANCLTLVTLRLGETDEIVTYIKDDQEINGQVSQKAIILEANVFK